MRQQLSETWETLEPGEGDAFDRELVKELAPGHPLYGREAHAIARSVAADDVLYKLEGSEECAEVHLTWIGKPDRPPWPSTQVYPSYLEWLRSLE